MIYSRDDINKVICLDVDGLPKAYEIMHTLTIEAGSVISSCCIFLLGCLVP